VVIEMSRRCRRIGWRNSARGRAHRLDVRCGNDFVIDIERAIYNLPNAGLCSAKIYDAVWTLPNTSIVAPTLRPHDSCPRQDHASNT
jgi:hypothetical protein